jgi:hypothetical protein
MKGDDGRVVWKILKRHKELFDMGLDSDTVYSILYREFFE